MSSPSALGTVDHWDSVYQREFANYKDNKDNKGDVWYGEKAESDAVDYYEEAWTDLFGAAGNGDDCNNRKTLDLGCGNGSMTVLLMERGVGRVFASDYVQSSVDFTKMYITDAGVLGEGESADDVVFMDDLRDSRWGEGREGGMLSGIADKGTMDAFLLAEENDPDHYVNAVGSMLEVGGFVVITSCNSTVEECRGWFEKGREGTQYRWEFLGSRVPNQAFTFGGVKGTTHFTVAFRKVEAVRVET
ncbi:hypothetical protein TrRE_jg12870 [Triparma retinervis]|uniref:Protein-lysine N-methyltransferase TrRE_jg12870 n=1 Tax=Triparma retinervis TaxID=2557542 RepID=A0A9W7FX46_9STRA|nr:hypothetical protein TrRE_jg12870 [Triparma retinervis]